MHSQAQLDLVLAAVTAAAAAHRAARYLDFAEDGRVGLSLGGASAASSTALDAAELRAGRYFRGEAGAHAIALARAAGLHGAAREPEPCALFVFGGDATPVHSAQELAEVSGGDVAEAAAWLRRLTREGVVQTGRGELRRAT